MPKSTLTVILKGKIIFIRLAKGYQISQFAVPIVEKGELFLYKNFEKIKITRAHLEEDAGKLYMIRYLKQVRLIIIEQEPLLEIVTEPELYSADEAVEYAKTLHELVFGLEFQMVITRG